MDVFTSIMGGSDLFFQLTPFSYSIIISSSIIYNGMLLILSVVLSFLFAYSIQTMHLVTLLKGKVPLKAHFGFPLYLSISRHTNCGLAVHRISIYGSVWQTYQEREAGLVQTSRTGSKLKINRVIFLSETVKRVWKEDVENGPSLRVWY